jgi:hypothetical protein
MKTINVYQFNELSEKSKEYAIEQYKENHISDDFYQSEIIDCLITLLNTCDNLKIKNYSLGNYHSYLNIDFNYDDIEYFTDKRAFCWIENNLLYKVRISFTGKKRFELSKYGSYYRAGLIKPCPFTGICYDEDFLESLIDDIKQGCNLKEAFENLAITCQKNNK